MPEIPRLNGVIKALEQGKVAFCGFASPDIETATALATSPFHGVAFEMGDAARAPFWGSPPPALEPAPALASSPFDGVAFEMEHAPMSPPVLRDALQYML